jgi:hypothetical protein
VVECLPNKHKALSSNREIMLDYVGGPKTVTGVLRQERTDSKSKKAVMMEAEKEI